MIIMKPEIVNKDNIIEITDGLITCSFVGHDVSGYEEQLKHLYNLVNETFDYNTEAITWIPVDVSKDDDFYTLCEMSCGDFCKAHTMYDECRDGTFDGLFENPIPEVKIVRVYIKLTKKEYEKLVNHYNTNIK